MDALRRHGVYDDAHDIPVIVKGDGMYIWDSRGKRYLDGLAGLFVVQVGHGRQELAEAAAKQAGELAFFPLWTFAHPMAIQLAERIASYTPGDLNRVFFTSGGGEAVETAWKAAKQYFKLTGKPTKTKVISREIAYHGTTHGALSITGIPSLKEAFEPLVPTTVHVANTNFYRADEHAGGAVTSWFGDEGKDDATSPPARTYASRPEDCHNRRPTPRSTPMSSRKSVRRFAPVCMISRRCPLACTWATASRRSSPTFG